MIMIPGSLSFAKLVMMSSAAAKSAGDARYTSLDPIIQSTLSHTITTPICIRSVFFLRQMQRSLGRKEIFWKFQIPTLKVMLFFKTNELTYL